MNTRHTAPFIVAFGALLPLLAATPALALTPKTDDLVTDVAFEIPGDERVEDETAFIGQALCRNLVEDDEDFAVRFTLSVDLSETVADESRFENTFLFNVDRDSTSAITCPDNDCSEVDPDRLDLTTQTARVEVNFQELTGLTSPDDCADLDQEYFVRLAFTRDIGGTPIINVDGRVIVDTIRPTAPTLSQVTATEGGIRVEFEPVDDADVFRYAILYANEFFDGDPDEADANIRTFGRAESTSGSVDVDLEPGATVWVGVAAQDEAGNLSLLTDVREAEVLETTDFWELYKREGGVEQGGCATVESASPLSSSTASAWLLGLLALVAVRIRPNRRSPRRDR